MQCCRSVTFWYGYGSADPYLGLTDPDPVPTPDPGIFVSIFDYYYLKLHLHNFLKLISHNHKTVAITVLLDYRRIRGRICTSYYWIRIRKAQKHTVPLNTDHTVPEGGERGLSPGGVDQDEPVHQLVPTHPHTLSIPLNWLFSVSNDTALPPPPLIIHSKFQMGSGFRLSGHFGSGSWYRIQSQHFWWTKLKLF